MSDKAANLTLANLCGGEVEAEFQHHLETMCKTFEDERVPLDAKRKMVLAIEFTVEGATLTAKATWETKFPGRTMRTGTSAVRNAKDGKYAIEVADDPEQLPLFAKRRAPDVQRQEDGEAAARTEEGDAPKRDEGGSEKVVPFSRRAED